MNNVNEIKIMPDYGDMYAWVDGYGDEIAYLFKGHPNYKELLLLEDKLRAWGEKWELVIDDPEAYHQFDLAGIELAKELNRLIASASIVVSYFCNTDNELGKASKHITLSKPNKF